MPRAPIHLPVTKQRPWPIRFWRYRPRFQVAVFSEDGAERLPEVYRFRYAAQMVAEQYNLADVKALRDRGGEWFERRHYRVVNAWPWYVRFEHWLRRKSRDFWEYERRQQELEQQGERK